MTKVLCDTKGPKAAFRYAACGCADQLSKRGGEVYVSPKGCGHKLCPRCGRKRGGRYARRIIGWLGAVAHEDLWTICLTQRIRPSEELKDARARMAPKVRGYMRWLTRRGLIGAMTTVHATMSPKSNGWHYHVHVMAELPQRSTTHAELLHKWQEFDPDARIDVEGNQCRLVAVAGPALAELAADSGNVDFWNESTSRVARAVQYPVRDMAQGVAAWRLGGDSEKLAKCAFQLVTQASGWKMFRAWGAWRKAAPQVKKEGMDVAQADTEKSAAPVASAVPLGPVGRCWRAARAGDQTMVDAFRLLERSACNASDFAKRLMKFCRLAWTPVLQT